MHTNVSERRLFVGIVHLYVRVFFFTYLFIVQTTWERPTVALDERQWHGFLDSGDYHYIRWGSYSLWSRLATLLSDLTLPEWPRRMFAPYHARWEEDKSLIHQAHFAPQRKSNFSQKEKKALDIICWGKRFTSYVYKRQICLFTTREPLIAMCGPKKGITVTTAVRLQRCAFSIAGNN